MFGWLADKIGRRKVFIITVLTFSIATGLMALTPGQGWGYLVAMRFIVGLGVGGMAPCSLTLMQEFVPTSKRGLISGLTTGLLPAGPLFAAVLYRLPRSGHRLARIVRRRPAAGVHGAGDPGMGAGIATLADRQGRIEDARRALAWALRMYPAALPLPAACLTSSRSVGRIVPLSAQYRRGRLTGLAQTGAVGLALWGVVLFVLVLRVTPAEAAYLTIWVSLIAIPGRAFGAWLSEAIGRRYGGALTGAAGAVSMLLAGYMHDWFIGAVSVYYLMNLVQSFFGNANFAVVFPYMVELWPANLRASGFGLVYGVSNLGKFIGPAGLALIAGASNYQRRRRPRGRSSRRSSTSPLGTSWARRRSCSWPSRPVAGRWRTSTPRWPVRRRSGWWHSNGRDEQPAKSGLARLTAVGAAQRG